MDPTLIVHILHYGLPLCRFTAAVPRDWPSGNKWVGLGEPGATCTRCIKVALERREDVADYRNARHPGPAAAR
jgi:hypothetical protein